MYRNCILHNEFQKTLSLLWINCSKNTKSSWIYLILSFLIFKIAWCLEYPLFVSVIIIPHIVVYKTHSFAFSYLITITLRVRFYYNFQFIDEENHWGQIIHLFPLGWVMELQIGLRFKCFSLQLTASSWAHYLTYLSYDFLSYKGKVIMRIQIANSNHLMKAWQRLSLLLLLYTITITIFMSVLQLYLRVKIIWFSGKIWFLFLYFT